MHTQTRCLPTRLNVVGVGVLIEPHGCKAWYTVQLVDNREGVVVQEHQRAAFCVRLHCCWCIAVIHGWSGRQGSSEGKGFRFDPQPWQNLVWYVPDMFSRDGGA